MFFLNFYIKSFFNLIRSFSPFSIFKNVNSFVSSICSRPFFISLHLFLGKIDLISEIIDLNDDSLYAFLTYFFNFLNNLFFYCFFTFILLISAINLSLLDNNFLQLGRSTSYIM